MRLRDAAIPFSLKGGNWTEAKRQKTLENRKAEQEISPLGFEIKYRAA
jgi:hypothetical protein